MSSGKTCGPNLEKQKYMLLSDLGSNLEGNLKSKEHFLV